MRILRVATRFTLFALVTTAFYVAWTPVRVFSRSPARRKLWRKRMTKGWAENVLRVIGVSLETRGNIPQPPFFAVANHLSYIDILCFAATVDCVFVARSDIASWPVFGMLAKSADTIFIDRAQHQDIPKAISQIEEKLEAGYGIVLFPEGTSSKGEKVLPFRASLLEPASRLNLAVYPAAISYRTPPGEKPAFLSVCWWGEMSFVAHFLEMLELSHCEATITFLPVSANNSDRKALAQELWSRIVSEFVPVISPAEEREILLRHPEYRPSWY